MALAKVRLPPCTFIIQSQLGDELFNLNCTFKRVIQ